jgi:hypothetical protein
MGSLGGFVRKVIVSLFLMICFIGYIHSAEEYTIDNSVKIYNGNLNELQGRITYYPENIWDMDNAVILYFRDFLSYGLMFDPDSREDFIEIIDKCIEWTEIAKRENVHKLSRAISSDVGILYFSSLNNMPDVFILNYSFFIDTVNGSEEILLLINYRTINQANSGSRGSTIAFKERDFRRLKEIFSEDYLLQYNRMAEEQRRTEELFR